jgi:SAM-dependent methyltransferase
MPQYKAWEREYRNPQLLTKDSKPQKDVLKLLKYLKKEQGVVIGGLRVLDLGCGTGRNSNYLASLGADVSALDISVTALDLARKRAREEGSKVDYRESDIGGRYPYQENEFDLVIDITSSNSLDEIERAKYLSETARVLKPGGFFLVKTLCKDGDKNAKELIAKHPGKQHDTYKNKQMGLVERVFTEGDFRELYKDQFAIIKMRKKTSYTRFNNQSYKRNFWLVIMQKK